MFPYIFVKELFSENSHTTAKQPYSLAQNTIFGKGVIPARVLLPRPASPLSLSEPRPPPEECFQSYIRHLL